MDKELTRQIPLTQGQVTLVSDIDYLELSQYTWYACKNYQGDFYVTRIFTGKGDKRVTIYMHRQILGLKRGDKRQGDHKNHNTLDNRRKNLRICTHPQNNMNRKSNLHATSIFKGVSWHKQNKKWVANIHIKKGIKYLGSFVAEIDAALAYNQAALYYFGKFAYVNLL